MRRSNIDYAEQKLWSLFTKFLSKHYNKNKTFKIFYIPPCRQVCPEKNFHKVYKDEKNLMNQNNQLKPGYFENLDPDPGPWTRTLKTWTLKNLDPEKLGPWKTWTLKNLDLEKPGPWKTWTLKNLDLEKHGKRLDMEKWLKDHIL